MPANRMEAQGQMLEAIFQQKSESGLVN